jgi:phage-related baseplate assembly protein
MPRRIALAAAPEVLRAANGESRSEDARPLAGTTTEANGGRVSGRVRHEEKITVYVSAEELLALEQARLTLRARHGMAVDRGRIVREAIAAILADLEASGDDSELVRRLSTS